MGMRDDLKKSQKHQVETKDSGGNGVKSMNIPKESLYKPAVGKNKIDIIPYKAGKSNPSVKEGTFTYVLDFWVHKGIGPNNDNIVCPAKNFHKPCPICEEIDKMRAENKDYDSEIKPLTAKRRVAYNVVDASQKEKVVKILETSHFLFEKELLEEALVDGEIICFADLGDEGQTISFKVTEEEFNKNKFFKFKNFSFVERDHEYDESFWKKSFVLDSLLNILSYEQISSIFFGGGSVENPDEDDEDEEDNSVPEDDEDEKPVKGRKKSKRKGIDEDEEDNSVPEDDEDEKPERGRKKSKKSDDESSEDEGKVCPHSHRFGKDYDKHDECDDCEVWKKCLDAGK